MTPNAILRGALLFVVGLGAAVCLRAALCGWVVLGWAVGLALAAWMGVGK